MIRRCLSVFLAMILTACTPERVDSPVQIENFFIQEMAPGQMTAAGYLVLTNRSEAPLVLNYVHTAVADRIEVHHTLHEDGMMRMRKIDHLRVAPGDSQRFEPGGYHLMLMGMEKPLKVGDSFEVVFEFEDGVTVKVHAEVRPLS